MPDTSMRSVSLLAVIAAAGVLSSRVRGCQATLLPVIVFADSLSDLSPTLAHAPNSKLSAMAHAVCFVLIIYLSHTALIGAPRQTMPLIWRYYFKAKVKEGLRKKNTSTKAGIFYLAAYTTLMEIIHRLRLGSSMMYYHRMQ